MPLVCVLLGGVEPPQLSHTQAGSRENKVIRNRFKLLFRLLFKRGTPTSCRIITWMQEWEARKRIIAKQESGVPPSPPPQRAARLFQNCMARAENSTRNAMLATKLLKYFSRRSSTSVSYIIQPLTNRFLVVGAGCNIEQALVGLRILHNSLGLAVHRKHDGPLALFELLHEVAGFAAESGQ